jgi:hypothetical protein
MPDLNPGYNLIRGFLLVIASQRARATTALDKE